MLTPQQQISLCSALLQFIAKLIYSGLGGQYTSEIMEKVQEWKELVQEGFVK